MQDNEMKTLISDNKLLPALALILIAFDLSYCQKLTNLSDAFPELRPAVKMSFSSDQIDFLNTMSFGFVTQGIVAISKDRSSLNCYRPDGSIAWTRQPPEKVISAIRVSENGDFICAYYPLQMEGTGVTEVLKNDGTVMWRKRYDVGFFLSSTGKYLYSGADVMDPSPLTVVETTTGNVLWKTKSDGFQPQLLNEETIIHVTQGELKLIEMNTGSILTQKKMSGPFKDELSYTNWQIAVSKDGNYVTLLGRSSKSLKVFVITYSRNLKRVWSAAIEPGYATLVGISEDGSKLCIDRPKITKLYDNHTGNLLWQVEDNILNNGAIVTNDFIALRQVGYESEIFVLGENGSLESRFKIHSIFTQTKTPRFKTKKGVVNLLRPTMMKWGTIVEIKNENARDTAILYAR